MRPSPTAIQLSAKKDLSTCSLPQQKMRACECLATPAVWEAAKENRFFLIPSLILRSAEQLKGREWLGEEQLGLSENIKKNADCAKCIVDCMSYWGHFAFRFPRLTQFFVHLSYTRLYSTGGKKKF